MELKPVSNSSNIAAVGHDPETSKLQVQFKNGKLFEYDSVSEAKHAAMMTGGSVGSYFAKNIKNAHNCVCLNK